ncbi:MAG: hypothetical protein ACJ8FM_07395 [Xanthobacteraceae bacterium]|jgi:hypothetical protein
MTENTLAKVRSFLIRGLAVAAVVVTYAVTSVGTQVASVIGVSTLALATTTTPAQAYWRGRRRRRVFFARRRRPVRRFFVRRRRRWRY